MDTRKSSVPKSPSGIPQEIFDAQLRQQQEKNQPFILETKGEDDNKNINTTSTTTNFSNLNVTENEHRRNKSRSPSPGHHHHRKIKSPGYYPFKKEGTSSFRKIDEKGVVFRPHDDINLDNAEVNEKMWQLMSTYLRKDVPTIERHIVNHIEYTLARTRYNFDNFAAYQATALSIRDRLIESWNDTQQYFTVKNVKRIYYLSMEFLMGRSLQNAIINMGLKDVYSDALNKMGHKLEELYDEEKDAALGNGGLGRLAACFMDSLATMDFPAWGYGIRYTYGMFQQQIIDGYQVEFPDYWLTFGNPWEIERLDVFYPIQFYGKVSQYTDSRGQTKHRWDGGETVFAVAYDTPVPGYDTFNCLNLRLWSSKPSKEFDLASFNSGDYYRAIESKQRSENITSVLYPNDNTYKGKELRLKQQYFFSSATLRDVVRRFKKTGKPLTEIPNFTAIQLNDTHPSISIAEMMRIMMDEEGLSYNEAWNITINTFAYTNHTVLPEALEKWSVELMENLLPRHLEIIYEINWNFLELVKSKFPNDDAILTKLSIVEEGSSKWIRMANLAIIGSHAVNGVAEIHSNILKESVFKEFYELWPSKFQNKTNGVTPRRWVGQANPSLSKILTEWSETDDWLKDMYLLNKLEQHSTNPKLQKSWAESKLKNKQRLADYVARVCSVYVDPHALFDVMVKRIHEYKRQFLNILGVIARYNYLHSLSAEERKKVVPRVFFYGGKAAPGYMMAKKVIKLINSVGEVVNKDPITNDYLKVVYIPNYNVSLAEIIIPASDVSEHISTSGTEASGTSNMKFAMNGSLIIGTLDGANVEIRDEIGDDNIFIFGAKKEEVEGARSNLRAGKFKMDSRLEQVINMISRGVFGPPDIFEPLINTLKPENDYYLVSFDFPTYMEAQEAVDEAWKNQKKWWKMSIESTSRTGKFNSDRTIAEYANDIWNVKPIPRPALECSDNNANN